MSLTLEPLGDSQGLYDMGYTLDIEPDGNVLRVRISGTVDSGSLAHDADQAEGIALAWLADV